MPRLNPPQTPLLALLRACSVEDRQWLAEQAGTSVSYLYHLATCKRTPSVDLAQRLVSASEALHKRSKTPRISIQQLACMCSATE